MPNEILHPSTTRASTQHRQAEQVKEMKLSSAEERFPFNEEAEDSHLIEVYFTGSLQQCLDFIAKIEKSN